MARRKESVYVTIDELARRCDVTPRQILFDIEAGCPCTKLPPLLPLDRAIRWREENRRPRRKRLNIHAHAG